MGSGYKKSNRKGNGKAIKLMMIISLLAVSITGCTQEDPIAAVEKVRQVSVVTVEDEAFRETIRYNGFITANQIIPLSFTQNGKVKDIKVEEGQKVKMGDVLVTLEPLSAKADPAGTLYASMDGVVAEVVNKSGDLIGAGYPVVVLRTEEQVIKVGVTEEDVQRIDKFGNPVVTIDIDGKSVNATLTDINRIPDESSRTYTLTVSLDSEDEKQHLIGQLVTVSFELARMNGIWLPISHVQNDGEDYVYIVNAENRVERRNLKLNELNNDLIRVEGLDEGDRVITVGNSFVKEGQEVTAREASNE